MKKLASLVVSLTLLTALLAGCGSGAGGGSISIVSREDGSGTRGAFVELFGIEQKDGSGNKVDHTTATAEVTNSTAVMMTTVAGNKDAIGYISMGSMNDTIKALQIDGADATAANVKSGTYKIARPFNIVTAKDVSAAANDFIAFILSAEGQTVVEDNGYISEGNSGAYKGTKPSGKIVVAGSSSVTPVMEKLKEAYLLLAPEMTIEIQQSDSTTGVTSTIEGSCDIGMVSRALKDSEKELSATAIALDGIAVIVNKESTVNGMTSEQVRAIYMGETTSWSNI
ncbi:MAG: substrate-binding domain-containing protein [Evtepia sp.]